MSDTAFNGPPLVTACLFCGDDAKQKVDLCRDCVTGKCGSCLACEEQHGDLEEENADLSAETKRLRWALEIVVANAAANGGLWAETWAKQQLGLASDRRPIVDDGEFKSRKTAEAEEAGKL